jgi:hypothetical protein
MKLFFMIPAIGMLAWAGFTSAAEAADITYLAGGKLPNGSSLDVWYTFDSTTAGVSAEGGMSYQQAMSAVSYRVDGGTLASFGPLLNSGIFVISDLKNFTQAGTFYNGYQAGAQTSSGYGLIIHISAWTASSVLIMPSDRITAIPNTDLLAQTPIIPGQGGVQLYITLPGGGDAGAVSPLTPRPAAYPSPVYPVPARRR